MLIQQQFTVAAPLDRAWAYLRDVPAVAACVPGVQELTQLDARTYQGSLRVKVGPLGFTLHGKLTEQERDDAAHAAVLLVNAEDRRLGSAVSATLRMRLRETEGGTAVSLETEANVLGKLGQFGQGVIKLAADNVLKQFVACAQQRLAAPAPAS